MKNKLGWTMMMLVILAVGCARVQVEAPKDPIKMDISMRLDVYQHVVKDVDDIEDIVGGQAPKGESSLSAFFVGTAYAEDEDVSPEAKDAAYRRRDRRPELVSFESKGILGESNRALIVMRGAGDARAQQIMAEENSDRMVIFQAIAKKRQSSIDNIQKVYADRLRDRLASGTPVQNEDGSWTIKN